MRLLVLIEIFFQLHDHNNVTCNNFSSKFTAEATFNQLKETIHSIFNIDPRYQHLFTADMNRINGPGSTTLLEIGLKNLDIVIVRHSLSSQWPFYVSMVQDFREAKDNRSKKEKAIRAQAKSKELETAKFFSAYANYGLEWLSLQKEYATFLDNIPTFIKEAAKSFFIRKFSDKFIEVEFKAKPSGTRSGIMCIVSYDKIRRVFYVKTNHNASSISITQRGPLNMIELFIYKLLEILNVGAVIDFIPNVVASDRIVYICGEEISGFKTIAMLEKDWNSFERKMVKKKENFARAIIKLSLLTQILGLGDLNGENVGFNVNTASLYIVDFQTGFIDSSVGFEGINRPKSALSLVSKLKMNLGRFFDLVKEMTFKEQLKIAKKCIVQWEISSKLDVALAKLVEEKGAFNRADLLFNNGTETLTEYISCIREKINRINAS